METKPSVLVHPLFAMMLALLLFTQVVGILPWPYYPEHKNLLNMQDVVRQILHPSDEHILAEKTAGAKIDIGLHFDILQGAV